jgi:hypothetical protein
VYKSSKAFGEGGSAFINAASPHRMPPVGGMAKVSFIIIQTAIKTSHRSPFAPSHLHRSMLILPLARLESRQGFDGFADLLFGEAQVVIALQVQPELCACIEVMPEAQRRISGDGAPARPRTCRGLSGHRREFHRGG